MTDSQALTPRHALVRVLGALSDENRFSIVQLLAEVEELSCGAICTALGLSPSLTSHHLSVLEGAGVVGRRKDGLWTLNHLRRDVLVEHIAVLERLVQPQT